MSDPSAKPDAADGAGILLSDLPIGMPARVIGIEPLEAHMDAAEQRRLAAIGFLPGEWVAVVAHSPLGRNPIAVSIGNNMFGLRRIEARCIRVLPEQP
jgi:ferrous iron transport protein A